MSREVITDFDRVFLVFECYNSEEHDSGEECSQIEPLSSALYDGDVQCEECGDIMVLKELVVEGVEDE